MTTSYDVPSVTNAGSIVGGSAQSLRNTPPLRRSSPAVSGVSSSSGAIFATFETGVGRSDLAGGGVETAVGTCVAVGSGIGVGVGSSSLAHATINSEIATISEKLKKLAFFISCLRNSIDPEITYDLMPTRGLRICRTCHSGDVMDSDGP